MSFLEAIERLQKALNDCSVLLDTNSDEEKIEAIISRIEKIIEKLEVMV